MSLHAHVTSALYGLGVSGVETVVDTLSRHYSEPHRAYHTDVHIEACLDLFRQVEALCERPAEVAMALLYHDVVYDPARRDNETRSAALARADLERLNVQPAAVARIERSILATALHVTTGEPIDTQIVIDIDMSILGTDDAVFDEYDRQIRREYSFVPDDIFRVARRNVLVAFLARDQIYATSALRDRFERKARSNIARALARLENP